MEKYLLLRIKAKLELLTLKKQKKVLKDEYVEACSKYNAFLNQKLIKDKDIKKTMTEAIERRNNKIIKSSILYIIFSLISIFSFEHLFITLEIFNKITSLLIAVLINLGIATPVFIQKIKSVFKEEIQEITELNKKKHALIAEENNLNNLKDISLTKYSSIKRQIERKEQKLINVNEFNEATPIKHNNSTNIKKTRTKKLTQTNHKKD